LRHDRLRMDPSRLRHLPSAHGGEDDDEPGDQALHATLPAGTVRPMRATIPALASASKPRRRWSIDAASVCGIATCEPCGRLAFTSAVFSVPLLLGVTSTATRLVYALTR